MTLLFSREQYLAAADAWLRGIERRIEAGLDPDVASVASRLRQPLGRRGGANGPARAEEPARHRHGPAHLRASRGLLASPRWQRACNAGARPQRLLWASTGTKDPAASDVLYVKALAAPYTVNTMPEATLMAFADHGERRAAARRRRRRRRGGPRPLAKAGVDVDALAAQLQDDGAKAFVKSWNELLDGIAEKTARPRPRSSPGRRVGGTPASRDPGGSTLPRGERRGCDPLTKRPAWRPSSRTTRRCSPSTCASSSRPTRRGASA